MPIIQNNSGFIWIHVWESDWSWSMHEHAHHWLFCQVRWFQTFQSIHVKIISYFNQCSGFRKKTRNCTGQFFLTSGLFFSNHSFIFLNHRLKPLWKCPKSISFFQCWKLDAMYQFCSQFSDLYVEGKEVSWRIQINLCTWIGLSAQNMDGL